MREHQIIVVQMFFLAELGKLPFILYRYTCAGARGPTKLH